MSGMMMDFAAARQRMVDGQIRPNRINDPRIIAALRRLPRERFVLPGQETLAYSDRDVPLGEERYLTEPRVIARMLQIARPLAGERALVVGAATGYAAVLLAEFGLHVTALEDDARLAERGRALSASTIGGPRPVDAAPPGQVGWCAGPLAAGWPSGAPYDLIVVDGAMPEIPEVYAAQLAERGSRGGAGRLVGVLQRPDGVGSVVLAEHSATGLRPRAEFDAATPMLPGLARAPSFSF